MSRVNGITRNTQSHYSRARRMNSLVPADESLKRDHGQTPQGIWSQMPLDRERNPNGGRYEKIPEQAQLSLSPHWIPPPFPPFPALSVIVSSSWGVPPTQKKPPVVSVDGKQKWASSATNGPSPEVIFLRREIEKAKKSHLRTRNEPTIHVSYL